MEQKKKGKKLPSTTVWAWAADPLGGLTWGLSRHHGGRGRDVGLVVWWRGERGEDASCGTPHGLRLRLQLIHQRVHHVDAHWRGWVVVLVDRASTGVLVAVHEHVQEGLEKEGGKREEKNEQKAAILSIVYFKGRQKKSQISQYLMLQYDTSTSNLEIKIFTIFSYSTLM